MEMLSVRNAAFTVGPPAPIFWQTLHQHTRAEIGASVARNRTAPHRQPPVIMVQPSSRTLWPIPRPQRACAMTVLFVVNIPPA